jgi:hypothetical protein
MGREDCHVPIFGLPYYIVGDDFQSLCQLGQRGEIMLPVISEGLEDLCEAHPSPFIIFHHWDHFHTTCSWFFGIPMIIVIWDFY